MGLKYIVKKYKIFEYFFDIKKVAIGVYIDHHVGLLYCELQCMSLCVGKNEPFRFENESS